MHCCLLVVAAAIVRRQGDFPAAFGFLPLLAVPFLYAELPLLIGVLGSHFHDAAIQQLESSVFGASPAATLAGRFPFLLPSELLHAGYLSYYGLIYIPPVTAFASGERATFDRTVAAVIATFAVCFLIFIAYPVAGPRYLWPAPAGIPDGPVRRLALAILAAGSAKGAAFPSSHVAVSVVQSVIALRWQRRVGLAAAIATTTLALGAVYGGFHYAIDVVCGAFLGLVLAVAFLSRAT